MDKFDGIAGMSFYPHSGEVKSIRHLSYTRGIISKKFIRADSKSICVNLFTLMGEGEKNT